MTTDTPGTAETTTGYTAGPGPVTRGRHRRPRTRKPLLAAACLVLAAGALSLVRLTSGSGVGGMDVAEAAPEHDSVAAAGGTARPGTRPTVPAAGHDDRDGDGTSAGPRRNRGIPATDATTTAPGADTHRATTAASTPRARETTIVPASPPRTETSEPPRRSPTPTPPRTTPPATDHPGFCVPLIGVCLDLPGSGDRR